MHQRVEEKNVQIIGSISLQALVYWEIRRGSYKKENCCDWLRRLLATVKEPYDNVVVVCDNAKVRVLASVTVPYDNVVVVCDSAPVYCSQETGFEQYEFAGAELLRTAPYSASMNQIEEC